MKKRLASIALVCTLVCGALGGCTPSVQNPDSSNQEEETKQTTTPAPEEKEVKEVVTNECLSCHPLDEVAVLSTDYLTESGETANPHRTVDEDAPNPHEATGNEKVIDCGKCHIAHETDNPSVEDIALPDNVNYCYTKCHHQRTFEACSDCHNDK